MRAHTGTSSAQSQSRNTSHRVSTSNIVSMIKGSSASVTEFKEKERRYVDKIKTLKAENKKLISLLKDSEKLFEQKLKETKQQSHNLATIFKQVWPLIKHKVKDPTTLLKNISGGLQTELDTQEVKDNESNLRVEMDKMQRHIKKLQDEMQQTTARMQAAENKACKYKYRNKELKAMNDTVKAYMHSTSMPVSKVASLKSGMSDILTEMTSRSSCLNDDGPLPSFIKAIEEAE